MGATTRDPNIDISVETGTPPSFQRTAHYEGDPAIASRILRNWRFKSYERGDW